MLLDLVDAGVVADGNDASRFSCGDGIIGGVDAAVELIAFALEAAFVLSLLLHVALIAAAGAVKG